MANDKTHGKTASGKPITDELVDELAAEAEAGYNVEEILRRRPGRPTLGSAPATVESVRLEPELRTALAEQAARDSRTTSEVIRTALRRHVGVGRPTPYMKPSELPELATYVHLQQLVADQIDMQLIDLWTLLRLPMPDQGLEGGCNLSGAVLALNIIAGASVLLYEASSDYLKHPNRSARRFKQTVVSYYPLTNDDPTPSLAADLLWASLRNPLVHSFGVGKDRRMFPGAPKVREKEVMVAKGPLSKVETEFLIGARERPEALGPTIESHDDEWVISVVALTWGVREMMRRLFADPEQAARADRLAAHLLGHRSHPP